MSQQIKAEVEIFHFLGMPGAPDGRLNFEILLFFFFGGVVTRFTNSYLRCVLKLELGA